MTEAVLKHSGPQLEQYEMSQSERFTYDFFIFRSGFGGQLFANKRSLSLANSILEVLVGSSCTKTSFER